MGNRLYRRSILTVLIVMFLACSIIGLTMMFSPFTAKADESLAEDPPEYTIYLGESGIDNRDQNIYYRPNFETGWGDVIELAQTAYKMDSAAYVKVVLARDWVATANSVDGFGKSASDFSNGRIFVPAGTNISIDLNGHKIDRNLTLGVSNGQVFYIQGSLTIADSATGGIITGGFNSPSSGATYGGGIYVHNGSLTLKGGSIEGNRVGGSTIYGIGVYVAGGKFSMYGGTIKNHHNTTANSVYGGGVCVNGASTFNMYDGVIEENSALCGGGVASYFATGNVINIENGTIRNNRAISGGIIRNKDILYGGGGIYASYTGDITIKGGEICNNTTDQYGGGIFINTNQQRVMTLLISGGNIHHNVASVLNSNAYGGGVAVSISKAQATINAEMTGGTIEYNKAVTSCENTATYEAQGGGLYVFCTTFNMKGGTISNNRAGSFRQGDTAGNLEDICDGINTYGGGVHVERPLSSTWMNKNTPFVLSGGTISDNRAGKGGGVNADGILKIEGGNISGNHATYGGGLNLDTYARVSLSGDPVIYNNYTTLGNGTSQNNLQISAADERRPQIVGALKDGARIGIVANKSFESDGLPFITSYGTHNSEFVSVDGKEPDSEVAPTNGAWLYTNPYRYFVSDTAYVTGGADEEPSIQQVEAQRILVLKNGELGISPKEVKFTVKYSDDSTKDYVLGKADQEELSWNCVDSTYGDSVYPVSLTAPDIDGAETVAVSREAGVYPLIVKLNIGEEKEVEFAVVVRAKKLTDSEVTVTLSNDGFKYDGHEKIPQNCTVKLKQNNQTMVAGRDYKLDYQNNINAGLDTAIVVVIFTGNYAGEVRAYFTIKPSDSTSTFTHVEWQVKSGEDWITFASSAYGSTFTYDGTNQIEKIRVYLTVPGQTLPQTVYAYGIVADDALQNTGMWLEFNGNKSVEFKDANDYYIEIIGYANYPLDKHTLNGIKINPKLLEIKESDFGSYIDEAQTRLWQLQIGEGEETVYTGLVDQAIYEDPDAAANEFGEKITRGELFDAYARYRGVVLSVILNGNFNLGEKYLQEWLDMAVVTYSHEGNTTGSMGEVSTVITTVKIDFGSNYILDNGNSYLEITKTWYIVTMSNNLRDATSREAVTQTALNDWTFGTPWQELTIYAFRPEHGDTVIYSYYLVGSEKLVKRFALVYSNDTYNASINYYGVKTVDGKLAVDRNSPIIDSNYLYTVHHELKAGAYRLEVTVPQNAPLAGEHRHWYDNDEVATDYGVRYYEFTFKFSFNVATYSLVDGSGALNTGIEYDFADSTVEYNGKANNYASPVITLNGLVLLEGEDYILSSENVTVGKATLKITGVNSITGEIELTDVFEIVQGGNGWTDVPSIISWTYNGFNGNINLISAKPNLLDDPSGLWFAIARDSAGADKIEGLDHFYVDENGHVSDEVAKILKGLSAGEYHLVVHVDETVNYRGLDPNPVTFLVFATTNTWEVSPSVTGWVQGEYTGFSDNIKVAPTFGNAHIKIVGDDGKVYYDSENGIDSLADAKAGRYTLTAEVEGTSDYSALDIYTVVFQIFETPGLPWWAILLIVVGALGIAALIIFILWKNGVFQIVTEKFVVAIRTRASVEATMASIRAAKMMEEGRQSIEDAKRRERIEKMRQKEEEQRELTPEEMALQLEAKAQADEKKAERLRARSQESREKAAQMRAEEGASSAEEPAADGETPNPETPTEE